MKAVQTTPPEPVCCNISVAIYTRVSTTSQVGGRFDSCESQAAICREYLARHAAEGWHEIACYTDAAYSGGNMNRPGIQALKRQIETGAVKVVLIFKLERVLRSTDEWAPFRAFLQQHGCRLVSTTEDLSEETPSGRLKNNLLVSVAEYERLNTAEKVRAKMLEQAKRGYWNYGLVPFGYTYDPRTQTLDREPRESELVCRIFEEAARLVPMVEIANALAAEGHRTRARVFQSRDGGPRNVGGKRFRSDSLRHLLRNPFYAGRVRFLGKEYPAKHPALVSDELWERANAAVAQTEPGTRNLFRAPDKHGHLLKGIVFCDHCGRALMPYASARRGPDGKPYRYYVCGYVQKERDPGGCALRHVSATLLEASVVAFLGEIVRHPRVLQDAVESSRLRGQRDRGPLRTQLAQLDQSLTATNRQINNCVDAIALGGAEALAEEIRARAFKLKETRQELLVKREQARQELGACEQDLVDDERIRTAIGRFGEVFPKLTGAEQKQLVQLCIDRIDVRADLPPKAGRGGGARQLRLRLKLPVARMVEGMEERVVIEQRGVRLAPMVRRTLTLDVTIALTPGGAAAILRPFERGVVAARPVKPAAAPVVPCHAIHRAIAWQRMRATTPGLTLSALAKREGVSLASVSFHLMLLRLAPEIRTFLLKLRDRRSIQFFGLVRMMAVTRGDFTVQRAAFAALRAAFRSE